MLEMRESDPEQISGRLDPADQQQDGEVEHLAPGQPFARDLGGDKSADEIVGGSRGAQIVHFLEIGAYRLRALVDLGQSLGSVDRAIARRQQIVDPMLEIDPAGEIDSDHVGHDAHREQRRKFPHEVEFAFAPMLGENIVDQLVCDRVDLALQRADAAWHERLVGELADPHVAGRIERDHRLHFGNRIIFAKQRRPELRRGKSARLGQHLDHVVPSRHRITLHRFDPGDRRDLAQLGIMRIGVVRNLGIERIVANLDRRFFCKLHYLLLLTRGSRRAV